MLKTFPPFKFHSNFVLPFSTVAPSLFCSSLNAQKFAISTVANVFIYLIQGKFYFILFCVETAHKPAHKRSQAMSRYLQSSW